jgi:two-component system, NtrC family, response regulator PilR
MGQKNKELILIIEDEEGMREALREWLTEGGYKVEAAKNGEDGLRIISDQDVALVLLDLRLPGKDGISVLKEAKTIRPQLKVIIITAYPSSQTKEAALKEGAADYLPKPFDLNDLEKLIRGTLLPAPAKGEAIAMLGVAKGEDGLRFALTGWEYIDVYLDSGIEDKKG